VRVADWARSSGYALRASLPVQRLAEDGDLLEDQPFLIAEALEHLDEVEGLSEEGRDRLAEFVTELAELRSAARRPVGEFLAEIVRRTGLLTELEAEVDTAMAAAKRRNLTAFLDQVQSFQPLEGDLTLRAFLDHVDSIDDDREWNPVQPSEDDSVKVMTVHAAKGLEFEVVFVPGLARHLFPNTRVQQNPTRKGSSLDIELRRDRELMPKFDGTMSRFVEQLREREEFEERRTAYVALTRTKQRLFVSSAVWYGDNLKNAKGVGKFLQELMAWAQASGDAETRIEAGDDEANPLQGYRQRFVRPWPGPAFRPESDALFPGGWRRAAAEAAREGGVPSALLRSLSGSERAEYEQLAAVLRADAVHLIEREQESTDRLWLPPAVSVSAVIDYARCAKRFFWSVVRPLPRFSGPAARIGTEIHRWIERQGKAQATFLEIEDVPDLTDEDLAGLPGRTTELRRSFLESRFAGLVPLHAERPFLLSLDGFRVTGRIDAIYGTPDGPWEVVDYKTGRRPPEDDPFTGLQLQLYALACVDVWGKRAEDLTLTYLYLSSGEEVSRPAGNLDEIRRRASGWLRSAALGRFEPSPREHCEWCDFRPFCDAGMAFVESLGAAS
jgi:DNA helicase-2/ATP-dependent DNA helicase PcrA